MSESILSDPGTAITAIAGIIGMIVGFMSIWSMLRTAKREQKSDFDKSNQESEIRLKEFFNLKLDMVNNKINNAKERINRIEDKNSS